MRDRSFQHTGFNRFHFGFVDENNDGINDLMVDANDDGINDRFRDVEGDGVNDVPGPGEIYSLVSLIAEQNKGYVMVDI